MKVCIVTEGTYPVSRGGVSEWTHQLIGGLPRVDFDVFCLAPTGDEPVLYAALKNLGSVAVRAVPQGDDRNRGRPLSPDASGALFDALSGTLHGTAIDCRRLADLVQRGPIPRSWLRSPEYWDRLASFYGQEYPTADFGEFFWTAHGIFSTLLDAVALVRQVPLADVYHALTTGLGGFVGCMAAALHDRPLVISEHGLYLKERDIDLSRQTITAATKRQASNYFRSLVKTSYTQANFLLPICQDYAAKEIALGAAVQKIRVVNNGIDMKRFAPPASRNGGKPVVGCFARVVPLKDQMSLIKASKIVLDRHEADFVFVGDIQDEEYYEECQLLVQQLGLQDHVKFVGHSDNVADWYRRSDVFVLSSQTEGLPLALLEAMSCGLPVVCTSVGGIPDVLAESNVGYIVPPGDSDILASRIADLLDDAPMRRAMGTRARLLVEEKYTLEKMEQKILDVYVEAMVTEHLQSVTVGAG
jgi:glycosyltransferase involved in cell wall biosynthesis